MVGAVGKLELNRVLGISPLRAADLWDGSYTEIGKVRSIEELRNLPQASFQRLTRKGGRGGRGGSGGPRSLSDGRAQLLPPVGADDGGCPQHFTIRDERDGDLNGHGDDEEEEEDASHQGGLAFGLRHHEELQEPIPRAECDEMRKIVLEIVRRQQDCRGCACTCAVQTGSVETSGGKAGGATASVVLATSSSALTAPEHKVCECAGCACCWHCEFVGGAPRRGRSGHDVDLLLWHKARPASTGPSPSESVLGALCAELEATGYLVPKRSGWQQRYLKHAKRQRNEATGVYAHRRQVRQTTGHTFGFENLSQDYHDKVFGIWRTAEGRHRRIDIVVCSYPEELPLCRQTWIGERVSEPSTLASAPPARSP